MKLILKRVGYAKDATYGVMLDAITRVPFIVTLERPWLENLSNVSCIPVGIYICKRRLTPKHGEVFEVTDVPGRTAILIHKGNVPGDSAGCILVGESFDPVYGQDGITYSRDGFNELMKKLANVDEFELEIR